MVASVLLMSNILKVLFDASHMYGKRSRSDQSSLTKPFVLCPTPLWYVLPIPVVQNPLRLNHCGRSFHAAVRFSCGFPPASR